MKRDVDSWWGKICGLYASRAITGRLFRKFELQYQNMNKKDLPSK